MKIRLEVTWAEGIPGLFREIYYDPATGEVEGIKPVNTDDKDTQPLQVILVKGSDNANI